METEQKNTDIPQKKNALSLADKDILTELLDLSRDAIIILDEEQTIQLFNHGAEHIFGYTSDEVRGKAIECLIPERYRQIHPSQIRSFQEGVHAPSRAMDERSIIRGLQKDGTEFPAEASISKYELHGRIYLCVILRDITARIKAELELIEAKIEAEKANKAKNDFLTIAAHDIKNPLSNIYSISALLQKGTLSPEEVQEYAAYIQAESQRMFELVTRFLSMNALESGKMHFQLEPLDASAALSSALQNYNLRASEKDIRLYYTPPEIRLLVFADKNALMQVLDNLVSNAVKYTPSARNIYLRLHQREKWIVFEVADEGPGISIEDRGKLFQQYTRLSARPTGGEHSSGLGLSIVKSIVDLMNGIIRCEDEPGKGAVFIVELPQYSEV